MRHTTDKHRNNYCCECLNVACERALQTCKRGPQNYECSEPTLRTCERADLICESDL